LKNRLLTTNGRVPTVLPKTNFPTFPVNHTTFPDLYRHTFHYRKHTIICNTSTNYLGMQILPSKRFCTRTFNCFYIHTLHLPLKVGQNKISTIRSITGTFSTQLCAIPNLPRPYFPGNVAFSPTFPDQSNCRTFSSFPCPVGTLQCMATATTVKDCL